MLNEIFANVVQRYVALCYLSNRLFLCVNRNYLYLCMISLIQLEYIVAVDTHRHFVKAAQHCFVTQPTLSMQIKKLEEELDIIVFDRSKQPILPTEIGNAIIRQARIILAESKRINEIIDDYNNTISGDITIGIIPSVAPYLLPLFIGKFTDKYPDVHLTIKELLTDEIIDELQRETIDVGILVTPLNEKGIVEEPLFYEEMVLYVNNVHPLAHREHLDANLLASPDLWLLNNGHCFRSQVLNLCGYRPDESERKHFQFDSGSLETLMKMVEIEGGYTLIPELAIPKPNPPACVKRFSSATPLREVSLAFTRNYYKKKILSLITQEIQSSLPPQLLDKDRGYIAEWRQVSNH